MGITHGGSLIVLAEHLTSNQTEARIGHGCSQFSECRYLWGGDRLESEFLLATWSKSLEHTKWWDLNYRAWQGSAYIW